MGNIIISILSVIWSFCLCVYAICTHQLWICYAMIVIGIIGILFFAYLKARGKLYKFVKKIKID